MYLGLHTFDTKAECQASLSGVYSSFTDLLKANENKSFTLSGYIYSNDIDSQLIATNNQYINFRNIPNMVGNVNLSLKIMSDNIKTLLINKYNGNNSDWVRVSVSGILRGVALPINGSGIEGMYLETNLLTTQN